MNITDTVCKTLIAGIILGFVWFCYKVLPAALPKSESEIRMERGCSLLSWEYTGKIIREGRIGYRKEIRTEYRCKHNGETLVYIR